jgi:glyoxylase-like metal-dependent hydrolase (beta-lactamase superfamily II)
MTARRRISDGRGGRPAGDGAPARRSLPFLVLLLLAASASGTAETLSARFLGNEAFEIRGGDTTLLTDFPYQSGAFGYMEYDRSELRERKDSLCLITHAHADHFDASLAAKIGCKVLAPPSVLARVPKDRALAAGTTVRFGEATIIPIRTDHGAEPHFSYLVEWAGLRLYFTGDTEKSAELAKQGSLDALFISPWLLSSARAAGRLPPATRIVVYHHQAGEKVPDCSGSCLVPQQGQVIEVSPREGSPGFMPRLR